MKTRTIVIVALIATLYVLFTNWMSSSGIGTGEITKIGWYNEYGEHRQISLYTAYVWLNLPYVIGFYLFVTLFLSKVKAQVNKWLGGTAFALWCVNVAVTLFIDIFDIYIVFCFSGDEMYRPLEDYWQAEGCSEHPVVWLMLSSSTVLYQVRYFSYLLSLLAFVPVFALLIKKDVALGITGIVVMSVLFVIDMFSLPYTFIVNLCWIVLFAVVLWKLYQSAPTKPFVLQ